MNKEELQNAWVRFTKGNDFILNTDKQHVEAVINGVLENEKQHGLKLCPCRLSNGTRRMDLELICPCNFKKQDCWKKEGRCWCGLFIKN